MASIWQSRFEKIKQQIKNDCRLELTHLIANRGKQVERFVILDFKSKIARRWDDLYKAKTANINQKDRFKIDIIDNFKLLKGSKYEEQDYVDTFLEYEICKIREHHLNLFSNADTITRKTNYFNEFFLFNSTNEEIVKFIASYLAYEELHDEFSQQADNILAQKDQEKTKERHELKKVINKFNDMPPLEVEKYFMQLTTPNPKMDDQPYLESDNVQKFVKRICESNHPKGELINLNISKRQMGATIEFFADFWNLCIKKDYEQSHHTVPKYFNLLIDNFSNFNHLPKNKQTYSRFSQSPKEKLIKNNK